MANSHELKQYLLEEGDTPFLLNDNNNGKTIMLSGAWGAGKTHFWQNEIESILQEELKKQEKACVYVSLYGKTSIDEIKLDIFQKAYNSIVKEDVISKSASLFSSITPTLNAMAEHFGEKLVGKGVLEEFEKAQQNKETTKANEILKNGSIICLDDFERKSKAIDLNDLFGFISQLALEMKCKVVIILNSDVFEGKKAEVFKNVKEKTINKYFYFNPTIEELFESIYQSETKYSVLNEYRNNILKAIKESEELNARLYIQVLDNCLEWHQKRELDESSVRVLVLATINFVLNHIILNYATLTDSHRNLMGSKLDAKQLFYQEELKQLPSLVQEMMKIDIHGIGYDALIYRERVKLKDLSSLINDIEQKFKEIDNKGVNKIPTILQEQALKSLEENRSKLQALFKYGYQLYYVADVDEDTYNEIAKFIESGILLVNDSEL